MQADRLQVSGKGLIQTHFGQLRVLVCRLKPVRTGHASACILPPAAGRWHHAAVPG